jgi:hypothetical protein
MDPRFRSQLAGGIALILIGVAFLAVQFYPGLFDWLDPDNNWPVIIIGVGVLLLIIGLLSGAPAMAIPACIVGGIGGLLYWQNATNYWESWAFAWTLIPGFVGVGIILAGLLSGQPRKALREGGRTIIVSAVLFTILGFLFGRLFGREIFQGIVWAILLIGLGVLVLLRTIFSTR